jgi:hypothetical protein
MQLLAVVFTLLSDGPWLALVMAAMMGAQDYALVWTVRQGSYKGKQDQVAPTRMHFRGGEDQVVMGYPCGEVVMGYPLGRVNLR